MFLRKFKLKFFILSALLLTLSSGLLFYRQLFIADTKSAFSTKSDLEELRYLDMQINLAMNELRVNLNSKPEELILLKTRINELMLMISDIKKDNVEFKNSYMVIKSYFKAKEIKIDQFIQDYKNLQSSLLTLKSSYNELYKNNIKFNLDGKDFYQECINDTLLYLLIPNKDSEWRYNEDVKIITQIQGMSKSPSPLVDSFYKKLENIRKVSKEMEDIIKSNKDKAIDTQITIVLRYDKEYKEYGQSKGETFLILIFLAIAIYVFSLVYVFRKL